MICLLFLIESMVAGVLVCAFAPQPWWWLPMFWVGGFILLDLAYLLLLFVISLFLGHGEVKRDSPFWRRMTVMSIGWILDTLRVRVEILDAEKLPDAPMVLISNHRSDFDPMVAMTALRGRRLAYVSKESNLNIPVAGAFVRRCSFLPIDRQNPRKALQTLKKGAELLREQGLDIGIYPEGTRTREGGPLPLKEGAFLMAKWANAPVTVMTTEGTERIAGHVLYRINRVTLRIVEVIPAETVSRMTVKELTAYAEDSLRGALSEKE